MRMSISTFILLFIILFALIGCKEDEPTKSESQDVFGKWKVTVMFESSFEALKYMEFKRDYTYTFYWESTEHSFKHIRKGIFEITESELIVKDLNFDSGGSIGLAVFNYSFDGTHMTMTRNYSDISCALDESMPEEDEWLLPVNELSSVENPHGNMGDLCFDGQNIWMGNAFTNLTGLPRFDVTNMRFIDEYPNVGYNIDGICFSDNSLWVSYAANSGISQFDLQTNTYTSDIGIYNWDVTDICKMGNNLWYCQEERIIQVDLTTYELVNAIELQGFEIFSLTAKDNFLYISTRDALHKCQTSPFKVVQSYNYPGVFGIVHDGTNFYANKIDDDNNAHIVKIEL